MIPIDWIFTNNLIFHPPINITSGRRIRPNLTSYDIVCATARNAPSRAYLDLEAQPAPKIEYTDKLEKVIINRRERENFMPLLCKGATCQRIIAIKKNMGGESTKKIGVDFEGLNFSFINSFIPSAKGCSSPRGPTNFGPLRSCIYPRVFRSSKVNNATASNMGTITNKRFITFKI